MNKKARDVKEYLDVLCSDAKCSLDFFSDYSLLIAVMLSAQCTDAKVNKVTAKLFSDHKTLEELNSLSLKEIESYLKSLGLYKNKAKYLKELVSILLERYGGKVPQNKDELTSLPGIGNKTANVVRIEWFNVPEFPVDTHVNRVSKRLGFADENDSVLTVEKNLRKAFPKETWIDLHHKFIYFGRYHCHAINPECECCKLKKYCHLKSNFLRTLI